MTERSKTPVTSGSHGTAVVARLAVLLAAATPLLASTVAPPVQPRPRTGERRTLDQVYALVRQRRFAEAQALWQPVASRVQAEVRAASGRSLPPAAGQQLQGRFAEVVFVQGLLEARLGRREDALRQLRQADGYGFPPLDSPLMFLAAECLLELQEPALAAQALRGLVKAAPANTEARLRLGVSLYAGGRLAEAEDEIREVLRRQADQPQAEYYLGRVLLEQKRGVEARRHLERELLRDGRCVGCMAGLAQLAYLDGDDRVCESWLAKAKALDPEAAETDLVYGMLYNRTDRPALAVEHLSRVVERAPSFAQAQYQLAIAYQRAGDPVKAREHREIYDRLIAEQKARNLGVRGSEP